MVCGSVLRFVRLRYGVSCCVTLGGSVLRCVRLRYSVSCCVTVSGAALQCVGLCYGKSRCFTVCGAALLCFCKNMNYLGHLKTSKTSDKLGGSPPVLL